MFIDVIPSGPFATNAILITCETTSKAIAIDPAPSSRELLLQKAKERSATIEAIYLTHSHWDHIADANALKEALSVPIHIHPLDRKNLEEPGSDSLPLFIPIEGTQGARDLLPGQDHSVGDHHFTVIHLPGHSPGGVGLYFEKEHVLIAGDTLFKGAIGRLDLPTAEPDKMWDSLKRLSELPKETIVYPGHGDPTTIGNESWLSRAKEIFS